MNPDFKDQLAKKAVMEMEKLLRLHGKSIADLSDMEKSLYLNLFMLGAAETIKAMRVGVTIYE